MRTKIILLILTQSLQVEHRIIAIHLFLPILFIIIIGLFKIKEKSFMIKNTLLENQVAIITGAGRGIGRATALTFAQAGASVVLAARSQAEITSVADEIKENGGKVLAIPTDISDVVQVDHLLVLTLRAFGKVDILVNNAAVVHPVGKVWETSPKAWKNLININVVGPYTARATLKPRVRHQVRSV